MPKVTVDGVEIEVPQGATVLQACELAGKEIPRFCYHERLSIAGNCRMCLVEVTPGPPKPQASCALPAADGQAIRTDTPMVKKAREGVMEFLLINHPLDCPICDQGGECDLQDQAMAYGRGFTRFDENKRAIDDKYMGPVIKTVDDPLHPVHALHPLLGRGRRRATRSACCTAARTARSPPISSRRSSASSPAMSPTSARSARCCRSRRSFESRPWELRRVPAIDVMDAVGTNIRLDVRQRQVMRILPRVNEDVNEEWISDKTRHHVDALVRNRLDRPWVREKGKLREASWGEALALFAKRLKKAGASVAAVAGDLLDAETMYAAKKLLAGAGLDPDRGPPDRPGLRRVEPRGGHISIRPSPGIENADAILLVGTNPRWEAPLVNTRLRKARARAPRSSAIGPEVDLGMKVDWLGNDLKLLGKLPKDVADAFANGRAPGGDRRRRRAAAGGARRGAGAGRARSSWSATAGTASTSCTPRASRMAGLILGFAQKGGMADIAAAKPEVVLLLGADEVRSDRFAGSFKVYIGHHGDKGARQADVVLPGAAYAEKHGTYVNTEGRVQRSERAVFPPGEAREDWTILRALSELARQAPAVRQLRPAARAMVAEYPQLGQRRPDRPSPGRRRSSTRKAKGRRLSDQGLLPDQRDLPRQPDDAALLGRVAPRPRRSGGRGVTALFQSWGMPATTGRGSSPRSIGILVIALPLMLAVAMIIYADRKIWAAMALRRGPNVVGPFGLLQSFADGLKVFLKETIIPSSANKGLFLIAPIITFTVALIVWAVIPFDAGRGAGRHQCRPALRPRRVVARRLRHDRRGLGVQLEISVLLGAPRRRADGEL